MSIQTTIAYDAIGANVGSLPRGEQAAGYTTGSGPVPWTGAQWAAHPGAVRIDQDPAASDPTADVLDVENGAATLADCPRWAQKALADYRSAARHGQRPPAVYASASQITPVVNSLISGGIRSGVGLWIANWNLTEAQARALVENAGGPFPVIGVQFRSQQAYDIDVFSVPWLQAVSGQAPPDQPAPDQPPQTAEMRQTKGNESLRGAAHYHGMTVQEVIWLTAQHSPGGFGPAQGPYISGGAYAEHMPDGMIFWVGPVP